MANNPFTDATTSNVGATFSEVASTKVDTPQALPPAVVDRTARMAAVSFNPDGIADGYRALTAQYSESIKTLGDNQVRYQAAAAESESQLKGIYSTMKDAPSLDPTGQLTQGLTLAAQQQMDADLQDKARYALEKRTFETIQDMAASDPTQARVLIDQIRLGDAEDQIQDLQVKKMVLGNLVNKAAIEDKDKPWFNSVIDFTLGFLSFEQSYSRGGLIDVDESMRHWGDAILSGKRTRIEAASIYSQDLPTFAKTAEQLVGRVKEHSTLLGYHNKSEALNLLSNIHNTPQTGMINFEDGINNVVGVIPLERMISIPSIAIRAGNRKLAAEAIADMTLEAVRSGTEQAAKMTGISESEVIAHNLPSSLNVEGPINTVPLTGDTITAVQRGEDLAASIPELASAMQSGRMSPSEYLEAAQKHRERISAQYGRELKDFRVTTNRLTSGQTMYQLEMDIGRKNGSGFASKNSAEQQARKMAVNQESGATAEPTIPAGMVRMYHGGNPEGVTDSLWFSRDRGYAENFRAGDKKNNVWYVDVPESTLYPDGASAADGFAPLSNLELPAEIANKRKPLSTSTQSGFRVIQDESGQWFIREKRDMSETSFYTTNLDPNLKKTGIVGRFMLGARQIDDPFTFELARKSSNARNRIMGGVWKQYQKEFDGITKTQEGVYLSNAASWGENKSVWLSRDELNVLFERQGAKQEVSDKAWNAYTALKDINDLEFVLRNDVDYATKLGKGFESVSFDRSGFKVERGNALVDRHAQNLPEAQGGISTARIFDASTNIHYVPNKNPLDVQRLKDMADDGYALVSLDEPIEAGGVTVKHILIKKGELNVERLRRDQLAYRAGGHRLYADKYFVKQASWGVQADTKEKFLKSPTTFIAGTKAEVEKFANTMEQARQLVKAGVSDETLDDILASLDGWDANRFRDYIEQGKIDLDEEITAMFDREMPKPYIQQPTSAQFHNAGEDGYTGWLRTNGRMYYSQKGEHLQDWAGDLARTVDPFETANMGIQNIANLASFADYKMSAVTRWVNTYGEYLSVNHLPKTASDLTKFAEAKYNSNLDQMPMGAGDKIRQQMEAQRDIIQRNLGWRSDWDRRMEQWQHTANNFVMGGDPTSVRHEKMRRMTEWWADKDPINATRGLVFDMKMGFFNVAQFPLQVQTILATSALVGAKESFGAAMNLVAMRRFLMGREVEENLIEFGINRGLHKANDLTPEQYREMMVMGKNSGFFEIHNSHQMMNYHGPNATVGTTFAGVDKFTRAGRFFFNEGEMWNRIMAYQVAYKEVTRSLKRPGGMNKAAQHQFTEAFARKVEARADDYSMNMTKESGAAWQHGLLSIPTQFWAYNARMMEAYFGKQFTTEQKLRLAVAQTFFYGAAGTPVGVLASDILKAREGGAPPVDSVLGMVDRGAIDEIIYNLTGADVLAGQRYGTGSWAGELVGAIFGMSPYGEKSFASVVGGSTYQIMGDTAGTLKDVVRYVAAESGTGDYPVTREGVLRAAKNISTVSYGMKAYLAYQYGAYYSNKGTLVATDLPSSDAWFFALGLQPGEQDDIAAMMAWKKNRKEQIDEISKMIVNQRARMTVEGQHRDEIAEETNAILRLVDPDLRFKALKDANNKTPKDLHTSIGEQVLKDKRQQELLNGQTN